MSLGAFWHSTVDIIFGSAARYYCSARVYSAFRSLRNAESEMSISFQSE